MDCPFSFQLFEIFFFEFKCFDTFVLAHKWGLNLGVYREAAGKRNHSFT